MVRRAERDPKSSVRRAMRAVADENRSFLQDITLSLPYALYRDAAKLQEFEAALYLVLSDLYEEVAEEERLRMCRHWPKPLDEIRASGIYAVLKDDVLRVAAELASVEDEDGKAWIRKNRGLARKKIMRILQDSSGRKGLLAATEIVDRDMPKQPRAGGGNTNIVVFRESDAALMEKALSVTKKETKLIGPSSGND